MTRVASSSSLVGVWFILLVDGWLPLTNVEELSDSATTGSDVWTGLSESIGCLVAGSILSVVLCFGLFYPRVKHRSSRWVELYKLCEYMT